MLDRDTIGILYHTKVEGELIDIALHKQPVDIKGKLKECIVFGPHYDSMLNILGFALTQDWKAYRVQWNPKTEEWVSLRRINKKKKGQENDT